jgi:cellulose synthase/poly-beta-1,6-N-acetylglucosamine synthase-like glycosyltransferase
MATFLPNALHFILILSGAASGYRKKKYVFSEIEKVTVVIPTRDEEVLIRKKLENIKDISPVVDSISVVIYDCSEDKTAEIAVQFIEEEGLNDNWKVIENCEIGKSNSVRRAIGEVGSGVMILTDADSYVEEDSFRNLLKTLSRVDVTAVCGIDSGDFSVYRRVSNWIRISESNVGATVVFEGSLCGFKMSHLTLDSIDVGRNADDSQLAVSSQRNGGKSLYVKECTFRDMDEVVDTRERQVRRAQGLVRHLMKEMMDSNNSVFIRLVASFNLHLYTVMPIALLLTFITMFGVVYGFIDGPFFQGLGSKYLMALTGFLFLIVANGAISVYSAILKMIVGTDLSIWKPMRESPN